MLDRETGRKQYDSDDIYRGEKGFPLVSVFVRMFMRVRVSILVSMRVRTLIPVSVRVHTAVVKRRPGAARTYRFVVFNA
jgi:hypothetical protein